MALEPVADGVGDCGVVLVHGVMMLSMA